MLRDHNRKELRHKTAFGLSLHERSYVFFRGLELEFQENYAEQMFLNVNIPVSKAKYMIENIHKIKFTEHKCLCCEIEDDNKNINGYINSEIQERAIAKLYFWQKNLKITDEEINYFAKVFKIENIEFNLFEYEKEDLKDFRFSRKYEVEYAFNKFSGIRKRYIQLLYDSRHYGPNCFLRQ